MWLGRHLRNLLNNLKWNKVEEEPLATDWNSSKLEDLFNEVCDVKQKEIQDALNKRNETVSRFLKEEKERFQASREYRKALFDCDVTKVKKYDTIEELEDAIDERLMELNDMAKHREICLAWLSHLNGQKRHLNDLAAKETDEAVAAALVPGPDVGEGEGAPVFRSSVEMSGGPFEDSLPPGDQDSR